MDTQMQNFWIESIKKEAALRFAWQLKYSKAFAKQAALRRKTQAAKKMNINSNISQHIKRIEEGLKKDDAKKEDLSSVPPSEKDEKEEEEQAPKPKNEMLETDPLIYKDMRPPSDKTKVQLYHGISHHGEGRYAYLKKRYQKSPEEKFVFPILSSNVYGWKIQDFGMPKCSPHARTRIVRDTFYRNSGIITGWTGGKKWTRKHGINIISLLYILACL